MKILDRIALVLVIIGGLNWGSIGFFGLDMVAALFGGSASGLSRLCISWSVWPPCGASPSFFGRTVLSGGRQPKDG